MPNLCENELCTGCGACAQVCLRQCITMAEDGEGFLYPRVDMELCVRCGLCERACPVLNAVYKDEPQPEAFAAHSRSLEIVNHSSSGGVFTLLATEILNAGGIVFGAAFDENWDVHHIGVEAAGALALLRGSKYVQSVMGDTYLKAKQALEVGRPVLFSGTPCQIAGLRRYLKKEYDKLLCVDTICHSVPSPKAWRGFLKELKTRYGGEITGVNFRDKRDGWQGYYFCANTDGGKEILYRVHENPYMQAFLKGLSTRPSCYQCKFKGINRESDITLGDFWGVQSVVPEAFFDKGTSLILVNSEKAHKALTAIQGQVVMQKVDPLKAVEFNPAYSSASASHPKRGRFFIDIERECFEDVVNKLLAPRFCEKLCMSLLFRARNAIRSVWKFFCELANER